jgi:nicotinate-nucleotide pyrophosphorylase (carboxylating)
LSDGVLIKNNHIALAGGIVPALERAHKNRRGAQIIEIEVRSLNELEQALEHGGEAILLDNMSVEDVKRAVERCLLVERRIPLEVSGGITLENVRPYAETGVNFISVGALTHSAKAVDMSMRLAPA